MGFIVITYAKDAEEVRTITGLPVGSVVGVYRLMSRDTPTCFGSCGESRHFPGERQKGPGGWSPHEETGIMVHSCGKPHRDWRARIKTTLFHTFGINLLARDKTPKMFQNPPNWGK